MIILDMDGVLANFAQAACDVHNHSEYDVEKWNFFRDWGISGTEFWDVIHSHGNCFYGNIVKPYPWLDQFLKMVSDTDEFIIMSSPSNSPFGYAAKKIWCDKYIGDVRLIVGNEKELLARKDRMLIDDCDVNIDSFREAGGRCITFPQPWNCMSGQVSRRLIYLSHRLEWWEQKYVGQKHKVESELYNQCRQE